MLSNPTFRARSMAAISSISSSHHRQSPQRRPNSGGGGGSSNRRSKSPAASSSRRRQYRSEMNLDKKTESSRAQVNARTVAGWQTWSIFRPRDTLIKNALQVRGTRRRLSSGGQGDNSSFYFSEGTVLDEVDHMLSSSDSELNWIWLGGAMLSRTVLSVVLQTQNLPSYHPYLYSAVYNKTDRSSGVA